MKKIILIALLLAPALSFAAEVEFLRDANFYCHCIITKPGDVTYSVDDTAFVTFDKDNSTAVVTAEHYEVTASVGFTKFGPWIKFSDDCVSKGNGTAFLGLVKFKFLDECNGLAFSCRGLRYFRRSQQ